MMCTPFNFPAFRTETNSASFIASLPSNSKIILLDTCFILDGYRHFPTAGRFYEDPARKLNAPNWKSWRDIISGVNSGSYIGIISKISIQEIKDNLDSARNQLVESLKTFRNAEKSTEEYYALVSKPFAKSVFSISDGVSFVDDLINTLISKLAIIDIADAYIIGAHDRVIQKSPPCHKKGEYKDAIISETAIDIARQLASHKMFFFTTNFRDFETDKPGKKSISMELAIHSVKSYCKVDKIPLGLHELKS